MVWNTRISKSASVLVGLIILMTGCIGTNSSARERNFTTMELLIPVEKLPPGWEVVGEPIPMTAGEGDLNDSKVAFKPLSEINNMARHWVWQNQNAEKAARNYEKQLLSEFNDNSVAIDGSWLLPDDWSFTSPGVDRFHVACAINNVVTTKRVCKALWQYDEFVVVFSSSIRPDLMTVEQFEQVIEEVDGIMVDRLKEQ